MTLHLLLAPPGMVVNMFEQEQQEFMVGWDIACRVHVPKYRRVWRQGWVRIFVQLRKPPGKNWFQGESNTSQLSNQLHTNP